MWWRHVSDESPSFLYTAAVCPQLGGDEMHLPLLGDPDSTSHWNHLESSRDTDTGLLLKIHSNMPFAISTYLFWRDPHPSIPPTPTPTPRTRRRRSSPGIVQGDTSSRPSTRTARTSTTVGDIGAAASSFGRMPSICPPSRARRFTSSTQVGRDQTEGTI